MSTLLLNNNATSTLAGPIAPTATVVNLATGTGSLFPSPTPGQYFVMTFTDAATQLINEIVWCTARAGDSCTIVRAQEGTAALTWSAGDFADNLWTAGQFNILAQSSSLQIQSGNYATDTGSVNAIVATLSPAPAALYTLAGAPIRIEVAHTTTSTTVTLNLNGFGPEPVVLNSGLSAPPVGAFQAGGVYTFIWDGTHFQATNAASVTAVDGQTGNVNLGLSAVATSGSYTDLSNKPTTALASATVFVTPGPVVNVGNFYNASTQTYNTAGTLTCSFAVALANTNYGMWIYCSGSPSVTVSSRSVNGFVISGLPTGSSNTFQVSWMVM